MSFDISFYPTEPAPDGPSDESLSTVVDAALEVAKPVIIHWNCRQKQSAGYWEFFTDDGGSAEVLAAGSCHVHARRFAPKTYQFLFDLLEIGAWLLCAPGNMIGMSEEDFRQVPELTESKLRSVCSSWGELEAILAPCVAEWIAIRDGVRKPTPPPEVDLVEKILTHKPGQILIVVPDSMCIEAPDISWIELNNPFYCRITKLGKIISNIGIETSEQQYRKLLKQLVAGGIEVIHKRSLDQAKAEFCARYPDEPGMVIRRPSGPRLYKRRSPERFGNSP